MDDSQTPETPKDAKTPEQLVDERLAIEQATSPLSLQLAARVAAERFFQEDPDYSHAHNITFYSRGGDLEGGRHKSLLGGRLHEYTFAAWRMVLVSTWREYFKKEEQRNPLSSSVLYVTHTGLLVGGIPFHQIRRRVSLLADQDLLVQQILEYSLLPRPKESV